MNKTQENILISIGEATKLKIALNDKKQEIGSLSFKLLDELRKIDGWEVMIQNCLDHYQQYPDEFFNWCVISYDHNSVTFKKGYSDGSEYDVLTITLSEDLNKQVERVKKLLEYEKSEEERDLEEKERAELKRLKEKYGDG